MKYSHRSSYPSNNSTHDDYNKCDGSCLRCNADKQDYCAESESVTASQERNEPPSNEQLAQNIPEVD